MPLLTPRLRRLASRLLSIGKPQERFRCNVCGAAARAPLERLTREQISCRCGSTVRQRAVIHVLSEGLFGRSLAIDDFPVRLDLAGLDMSGAGAYAERLPARLGFVNTFFHKEPRLDITSPGLEWRGRWDFVISSDVFEHIAPPVSRAFSGAFDLLRGGGLFVLTVPFAPHGVTTEHFPGLQDYHVETRGSRRVLVNRKRDGSIQEFENLIFHGGPGATLEMRVFSRDGLLDDLARAGFSDIRVHGEAVAAWGIHWQQPWSLPISARRPP